MAAPTATASSGFLHRVLHLGHARHAAHQDHVFDVGHLAAGVLERDAARLDRPRDQVFHQAFELGAGDLDRQMFRARGIGRDVGQIDLGLLARGQFDLGLLRRVLEALQCQHVVPQVDALFLLEFVAEIIDHALVEVLAAEKRVAVGGQHFELVFVLDFGDFDDGDIEGAASQVIDRDLAVAFLLVHAKSERGGGGLVDDALDVQAGDAACILGRLALRIVEVRRNRDHRFGDFLAEIVLGGLFHLAQHLRGNLLRRDSLAAHLHPGVAVFGLEDLERHEVDVLLDLFFLEAAADQALDRVERVFGVGHGLALCGRADQDLPVLHVGDGRWRGARALGVDDHLGLAALHDGHAGVGRAEVDSDYLSHGLSF